MRPFACGGGGGSGDSSRSPVSFGECRLSAKRPLEEASTHKSAKITATIFFITRDLDV